MILSGRITSRWEENNLKSALISAEGIQYSSPSRQDPSFLAVPQVMEIVVKVVTKWRQIILYQKSRFKY